MRGAADLVGLTVGLPRDFHGPVDYSHRWAWFALLALALVAAYYVASVWLTRPRPAPPPPPPPPAPDLRTQHLARIDAIDRAVRSGELPLREGHQRLSEVVREYVERVTSLPATTMSLADLRLRAPRPLVVIIEAVYPPEFAPDQDTAGEAAERFGVALHHARGLVSTWRR